jgi:hypothetical protein
MNIETLRLGSDSKRATLDGVPVLVRISGVTSEAYIVFPQERVDLGSGNVTYVNRILGAKDAQRLGYHLELCK